jgi:hypothetical protein
MWPGQKIANVAATERGLEAVWAKALGYVTGEPYRRLLAKALVTYRFYLAISRSGMTVREALAKVTLARSTSPDLVSALSYGLGCAAIILPGGRFLVRSERLRRVLAPLFLSRLRKS